MPSIAGLLAAAKACRGLGQHVEALNFLRQAVQLDPDCAEPHQHLGSVLEEQGRLDEAAACYQRVVQLVPGSIAAYGSLGNALKRQGKLNEAAACYQKILEIVPDCAEAHIDLGLIAQKQSQFDLALAHCRRAVELRPDLAHVHANLGGVLACVGRNNEAVACYRGALALAPNFAAAHGSLSAVLGNLRQFDEAVACGRRALELMPDFAEAHYNLALAVAGQGKLDEAVAGFQRAVELAPQFAEAHANLGAALGDLGRISEAATSCRRALELNPQDVEAYANLASLFNLQSRVVEAQDCYAHALRLRPQTDVWRLNAATLCPAVFRDNDQIDTYRRRLLEDLERFTANPFRCDAGTLHASGCMPPFNLQFHGRDDRPIREAYARIFRDCFPQATPRGSGGRRRIGFVVTSRHEKLFVRSMGGILEHLPSGLFELVIVCSRRGTAGLRASIHNNEVAYLELPTRLDEMAAAIREARFDVLYHWEVGTDSTNYFLPQTRLAPVQCTAWGIQVTSGIAGVDYYLSSSLVEPEGAQQHYTEKLVLASTLLTWQDRVMAPAAGKTREDFGIAADAHLYLCAQQLGKFHPDFDPILADILRRDVKGVIVIVDDQHGGFIGGQLRERFRETLPDVMDRTVFVPFQPTRDYLSLVAAADVLLDPLHFGGVNTTYDGFSLNKPIVTLPSQFHRGRYTTACYRKMGTSDCVASSPRRYVDLAVALGTDRGFRADVTAKIRDASPALFEDSQAVNEHERIFKALIEEACTRGA